ncbi:hypothetical protein PIB30_067018 [Stylosanthes scabra]|uniref:Uncharacterized protein n=1 Tax=Stylosanthes scabra TaxID=79078 RepID=A0ABU6XKC6_9FABA|nr:hypothetical protein [Stylosanthes scabra]
MSSSTLTSCPLMIECINTTLATVISDLFPVGIIEWIMNSAQPLATGVRSYLLNWIGKVNLLSSDKACAGVVFSTCKLFLGSHYICVEFMHQILAYLGPWLAKSPPPSKADLFTNFREDEGYMMSEGRTSHTKLEVLLVLKQSDSSAEKEKKLQRMVLVQERCGLNRMLGEVNVIQGWVVIGGSGGVGIAEDWV